MCCLFGILDYGHNLTSKQRNRMISVLATACELRGTDATGIAYNSGNDLRIFKRPIPAHKMKFHIPKDAHFIMGHTRMTTQGNEKFNYNNHPFYGMTNDGKFALAHNGVLRNDIELRAEKKLPETRIETDSYIAVQLIEQQKQLDFATLRYMAEQLEGSFTIEFVSKKEAIDTSTPTGKFMLTVFGAVAELEREYILQRQREGIAIAKENGVYTGRKSIERADFVPVVSQWRKGQITAVEAMKKLDMTPSTFYRKVRRMKL